jgi:hypothetical protein
VHCLLAELEISLFNVVTFYDCIFALTYPTIAFCHHTPLKVGKKLMKSYTVTRVPGPWRRETVQKRGDAVTSMTEADARDLAKGGGADNNLVQLFSSKKLASIRDAASLPFSDEAVW